MQIRVYYEDTDAGGIVYHSNYLNFCERARSEFFFKKGLLPIINEGHFVVRHIECDFLKSAKFGDLIDVTTEVIEIKKSSLTILQEIKRDNIVLFKASFLLVLVNTHSGKIIRLDKEIQEKLNNLFS
jgi:acyl-CoA thioester hydrolase